MKIIGIIVEYNPLHNGHIKHFNSIPKSDDDIIIAVMSGNLVNRGEISVFNKFDKTALALEMGVNLVLELPSVFSIQSGDTFAKRAIEILSYAGCTDVYFGSESNDITLIDKYYSYTCKKEYNDSVKKYLKDGLSYKSATLKALEESGLSPLSPNDVLGLGYYKAIIENNYPLTLHTIKRDDNYSSPFQTGEISSATSIRLNPSTIQNAVPKYTYDMYRAKGFLNTSRIFNYLKVIILTHNISDIFLIDEGFENAIYDIYKYNTYDEYLKALNTKRYSIAKISRIMLCILFNIKNDDMNILNHKSINFIRVLGYDKSGQEYLRNIKHDITIYTNIKEGLNDILDYEIKISKVLDTIYNLNNLELEQSSPIKK